MTCSAVIARAMCERFVCTQRASASPINYGHYDLLLGAHAPSEVYPLIGRWLDERCGAARPAADRAEAASAPGGCPEEITPERDTAAAAASPTTAA